MTRPFTRVRVLAAGFCGLGDEQDHQSSMYLPALAEHAGFDVVAVVPLDGAAEAVRAKAAGAAYDVPVLASLAEGLERADVDAVCVSARGDSREAVLTEVMRAGKHVLADKPLALTAAEVGRLREVRDETGRVLAVAHHQRFQPMLLSAASAVAAGRVGLPWNIQADFLVAGGRPVPGGELLNFGLYPVDVLFALTGLPVRRVYAQAHEGGDLIALSLDHDRGLTSTVVVGRTGPRAGMRPGQLAVHRYRVSGSHGTAVVDATRPVVDVHTESATGAHSVDPGTLARMLDDWHLAVVGGARGTVSAEEALEVAEVLDAARRSLTSGRAEQREGANG